MILHKVRDIGKIQLKHFFLLSLSKYYYSRKFLEPILSCHWPYLHLHLFSITRKKMYIKVAKLVKKKRWQ